MKSFMLLCNLMDVLSPQGSISSELLPPGLTKKRKKLTVKKMDHLQKTKLSYGSMKEKRKNLTKSSVSKNNYSIRKNQTPKLTRNIKSPKNIAKRN